jgi:nitrogen regulatory protein P-II 2
MKLITAIIRPHQLPKVKDELLTADISKMTVSNVIGAGQQAGYEETYRGTKFEINLNKKIKIEIAVNDKYVEKTVEAIINGANTGEIGDGKIFITELNECIRIRTGETGSEAIG